MFGNSNFENLNWYGWPATRSMAAAGFSSLAFLEWLERDFKLSEYSLSVKDGQFHLSFDGLWTETTMWELYALSILDELRTRANLKTTERVSS